MHYLAHAIALPACPLYCRGIKYPLPTHCIFVTRGDNHLEIVIFMGLLLVDSLDLQATDLSSNYVRMAVLSHFGSDPYTFILSAIRLLS